MKTNLAAGNDMLFQLCNFIFSIFIFGKSIGTDSFQKKLKNVI